MLYKHKPLTLRNAVPLQVAYFTNILLSAFDFHMEAHSSSFQFRPIGKQQVEILFSILFGPYYQCSGNFEIKLNSSIT